MKRLVALLALLTLTACSVPQYDADGNPLLDSQGNPVTVEVKPEQIGGAIAPFLPPPWNIVAISGAAIIGAIIGKRKKVSQ